MGLSESRVSSRPLKSLMADEAAGEGRIKLGFATGLDPV